MKSSSAERDEFVCHLPKLALFIYLFIHLFIDWLIDWKWPSIYPQHCKKIENEYSSLSIQIIYSTRFLWWSLNFHMIFNDFLTFSMSLLCLSEHSHSES